MLNEAQVAALMAFLNAFDMTVTGAWPGIEQCMREEFGIEDPEAALSDAREALSEL